MVAIGDRIVCTEQMCQIYVLFNVEMLMLTMGKDQRKYESNTFS